MCSKEEVDKWGHSYRNGYCVSTTFGGGYRITKFADWKEKALVETWQEVEEFFNNKGK